MAYLFDGFWTEAKKYLRWRLAQEDIEHQPTPEHDRPSQLQINNNVNHDFKITIVNNTGKSGTPGRSVNVMLFQKVLNPLTTTDECCAWQVLNIPYPGQLGPFDLPTTVEFYVIDHPSGILRETGPFKANFGQVVHVTQKTKDEAPSVDVVDSGQQHGGIKVNNISGNVQPLEMALFKNGKKIASSKQVNPADSVSLAIKPALYIAHVDGVVEGQDFLAATHLTTKPAEFELFNGKHSVKIQITQLPSGELEFSEL